MTMHWGFFVPGVMLLLFPADRLLSSAVELRSFHSFQSLEDSPRHRPWWWAPSLWLDPLRGFFGTLLLRQALGLVAGKSAPMATADYVVLLGILVVGVLAQAFTRRGQGAALLAPIGFVAGAALALVPWAVAVMAVVSAGVGLFAFRQFQAFFVCGAAAVGLLGFVLRAELIWVVPAVGVFLLPLAVGLAAGRTLELPVRNASGPGLRPLGRAEPR